MNSRLADEGLILLSKANPDWRNRSHMFPTVYPTVRKRAFCLRNDADKPSGAKELNPDADSKDKSLEGELRGEDAESFVYSKIEKLGHRMDKPVMAFRSLKIGVTLKHWISQRCPDLELPTAERDTDGREKHTEIDLLCLHETTGIVILEVKGPSANTRERNVLQRAKEHGGKLEYRKSVIKSLTDYFLGPCSNQVNFTLAIVHPFHSIHQDNRTVVALREKGICMIGKDDCIEHLFNRTGETATDWFAKLIPPLTKIADVSGIRTMSYGQAIKTESAHLSSQVFFPVQTPQTDAENQRKAGVMQYFNRQGIKWLTPEQFYAWDGPERQLIRGHAGTGKTCLLMARVDCLAQNGTRVFVYARDPSHLLYEQFAKRCHIAEHVETKAYQSLREDFESVFSDIFELDRAGKRFEDIVAVVRNEITATLRGALQMKYRNDFAVIFDDVVVESDDRALDICIPVMVAATMTSGGFGRSVWASTNFNGTQITKFLRQCHPARVSELRTVVRHARNVYQSYTHSSFCAFEAQTFIAGIRSFIGHRCLGMTTRHFDVDLGFGKMTPIILQVTEIISDQLHALSVGSQHLTLQDVLVLVDNNLETISSTFTKDLKRELEKHVGTSDIRGQIQAGDLEYIAVDNVLNSYSIERDVVFFIKSGSFEEISRLDEVAMTRCVTALITISVLS